MSAATTHNSNTTDNAGVPPAPPEAHQKAAVDGDTKEVVLNGACVTMKFQGGRWWNTHVA
jgi:hypothetical protein